MMAKTTGTVLGILVGTTSILGIGSQVHPAGPPAASSTYPPIRFVTTDSTATDVWPAFSPDGQTILFSRSVDRKTWVLMTVPATGGEARPVNASSLPRSANRPAWSSRTGRIAFTGEDESAAAVWTLRTLDGKAERIVAAGLSNRAYYPSWYPDGKHILVVDFGSSQGGTVKRIDVETRVATSLTDTMNVWAGMPAIAPGGDRIAFAGQSNHGQPYDQRENTTWVLGPDGSPRNLVPGQGRAPRWSEDGRWLAFESNRDNAGGRYAVFIVRADGTGLRQVTDYTFNANHPVWSPDDKSLVVDATPDSSRAHRRIAVVDLTR